MTFYLWNSKTSSFGDKLLTIYRYTAEEWKNNNNTNIIELKNIDEQKSNAVFGAELFHTNADDELNITAEEVMNAAHAFWKN